MEKREDFLSNTGFNPNNEGGIRRNKTEAAPTGFLLPAVLQ